MIPAYCPACEWSRLEEVTEVLFEALQSCVDIKTRLNRKIRHQIYSSFTSQTIAELHSRVIPTSYSCQAHRLVQTLKDSWVIPKSLVPKCSILVQACKGIQEDPVSAFGQKIGMGCSKPQN